jgi:hypothetical protein
MSNFDFKKLREQVKETGNQLREVFKATDAQIQAVNNRDASWHESNSERLKDHAYMERWRESLRNSEKLKEARKTQKQNPKWKTAHSYGMKEYVRSPEYVNP